MVVTCCSHFPKICTYSQCLGEMSGGFWACVSSNGERLKSIGYSWFLHWIFGDEQRYDMIHAYPSWTGIAQPPNNHQKNRFWGWPMLKSYGSRNVYQANCRPCTPLPNFVYSSKSLPLKEISTSLAPNRSVLTTSHLQATVWAKPSNLGGGCV